MQLTQDSYFPKTRPLVGLKPAIYYILGRRSTNGATEAAQLAESHITLK